MTKKIMTKHSGFKTLSLFVLATLTVLFSACNNGKPSLSASKAKSLANDVITTLLPGGQAYTDLKIGYFECNDFDKREMYRILAEQGMVKFKCDTIERASRSWQSETYFVTVELTEKGQKYTVEEIPTPKPYDKVTTHNLELLKKNSGKTSIAEMPTEEPIDDYEIIEAEAGLEDYEDNYSVHSAMSAYEQAKEKEHVETVIVKSHKLKVIGADYILSGEKKDKELEISGVYFAAGRLTVEYTDVTPFARNIVEGWRVCTNCHFIYYDDKGWMITELGDEGDDIHDIDDWKFEPIDEPDKAEYFLDE